MNKYHVRRERLRSLLVQRFSNVKADLARAINKDPSYVSRLLFTEEQKGFRRIADDMRESIESSLQLPYGWLDGQNTNSENASAPLGQSYMLEETSRHPYELKWLWHDLQTIPMLDLKSLNKKGKPLTYEGKQIVDRLPLSRLWIEQHLRIKPNYLKVITATDDGMAPTFRKNDILLVDISRKAVDEDGVYLLSAFEKLFIKRIHQRVNGKLEISCDNPAVKTVDVLEPEGAFTVHGRVVWSWNGNAI